MTTPAAQPDRDTVLQGILDGLSARHEGGDPEHIRDLLESEMTTAGLAIGAKKWIRDTADEISAGRMVVVDSRQDRRWPDAT